ncbi:hypothetical protein [Nocardia sp. A7]|uniref:hypothetical protein n=1 Tax=Nocardia sp. A7 TaxID=2789274 RepID=UPI00397DC36A
MRQYVSDGSVVIVPPPTSGDAIALRWQIDADFAFPLVGGYFVGPSGEDQGAGYSSDPRSTAVLLMLVRMRRRPARLSGHAGGRCVGVGRARSRLTAPGILGEHRPSRNSSRQHRVLSAHRR